MSAPEWVLMYHPARGTSINVRAEEVAQMEMEGWLVRDMVKGGTPVPAAPAESAAEMEAKSKKKKAKPEAFGSGLAGEES